MGMKKKPNNKATETILSDKKKAQLKAQFTLLPSINAAAIISEYAKPLGEQDINELMDALLLSINDVNKGDLQRCEAMLMGQAYALQSIFMALSRKAITQEYLKNYETFLRLALKSQSQCRATLETLAALKNPPVIFAKQANIANGHQQVNNGISAPVSLAGENKILPNELLEAQHGSQTMDTGTTIPTITKNKAMATVE